MDQMAVTILSVVAQAERQKILECANEGRFRSNFVLLAPRL
ncbi:hypothetical protein EBL_c20960 [Shimwellia blattae DSM 4481 = NBRC 105725]|uniref:Uncharacterized protein n=1 Tax=Shimwellia blattae (strain ATCC 29907 / DSM 4481 / JCM 1650 / NBRC 105725 / CDC 9005-74) TaxID=630626 RepID=I2B9I3_SHIBC|nr:hypothetical protein EBL_c20960 [Shimwellia blattae DSM 4481 = NBRC 105725]